MVKEEIKKAILFATKDFDLGELSFVVEHPGDETKGDYATNVAMVGFRTSPPAVIPAKAGIYTDGSRIESGMTGGGGSYNSPRELAEKIKESLDKDENLKKIVDKIEIAGPARLPDGQGFINFWLKKDYLLTELSEILKAGDDYGKTEWAKGKTFEVEHTSPNPNKAMHLGHLRNNVTGMAIANLFEAGGAKVIRDAVDNNRGIAIAKLMWGYLKFAKKDGDEGKDIEYWFTHQDEWSTPDDLGLRPDRFVDEYYVKGSEDFKNKPVEEEVRQIVVDWEAEDKKTWALWKIVLDYSYAGQALTLARLGNQWDRVWHEHEHYKEGKVWVEKGIKKGVFKVLPDGAVLTNLEKFGLTDTIVIKSDGTALYITQDLALTALKRKTYKADKLYWVIGPEQSLDLKQMFAVCEQLGIGKVTDFTHIPYGYMSIKGQGKMSSRAGNVVYIDQLLDMASEEIKKVTKKRDYSKAEEDETAEILGVGSVKYSILKVGRMTNMAFDLESSISFEGDSGPYLNYVYVRTLGVAKKAGKTDLTIGNKDLNESETSLLRYLCRFPEIVTSAGEDMSPNIICSYLFELAQKFNIFYGQGPIVGSGVAEGRRLALNKAVGRTIKNGLRLLGIKVVEKM